MAFLLLSSITELDRINLLKAVTSISEINIFLNQENGIEMGHKEFFQFVGNDKTINCFSAAGKILLQHAVNIINQNCFSSLSTQSDRTLKYKNKNREI